MIYKSTRVTNPILACVLALVLALGSIPVGSAQNNEPFIRRIPSMEAEQTGLLNPAGLAFSSSSKTFYVAEDQGQAPTANSEVVALTSFADRRAPIRIAGIVEDPLNMVFDNQNNRLLAYQATAAELLEVRENPSGNLEQTSAIRHKAQRFNIQNPQGLTLDEEVEACSFWMQVDCRSCESNSDPAAALQGTDLSHRFRVEWFGDTPRHRLRSDNGTPACARPDRSKVV